MSAIPVPKLFPEPLTYEKWQRIDRYAPTVISISESTAWIWSQVSAAARPNALASHIPPIDKLEDLHGTLHSLYEKLEPFHEESTKSALRAYGRAVAEVVGYIALAYLGVYIAKFHLVPAVKQLFAKQITGLAIAILAATSISTIAASIRWIARKQDEHYGEWESHILLQVFTRALYPFLAAWSRVKIVEQEIEKCREAIQERQHKVEEFVSGHEKDIKIFTQYVAYLLLNVAQEATVSGLNKRLSQDSQITAAAQAKIRNFPKPTWLPQIIQMINVYYAAQNTPPAVPLRVAFQELVVLERLQPIRA
jgi:hypothetical protein